MLGGLKFARLAAQGCLRSRWCAPRHAADWIHFWRSLASGPRLRCSKLPHLAIVLALSAAHHLKRAEASEAANQAEAARIIAVAVATILG